MEAGKRGEGEACGWGRTVNGGDKLGGKQGSKDWSRSCAGRNDGKVAGRLKGN